MHLCLKDTMKMQPEIVTKVKKMLSLYYLITFQLKYLELTYHLRFLVTDLNEGIANPMLNCTALIKD